MLDALFNENGLFLALAFIAFIQLIIWLWPSSKGRHRKSLSEQNMQEIIAKLTPDSSELIKETLRSNRKTEAIKILRAETDAGLLEAKNCIEKLSADLDAE